MHILFSPSLSAPAETICLSTLSWGHYPGWQGVVSSSMCPLPGECWRTVGLRALTGPVCSAGWWGGPQCHSAQKASCGQCTVWTRAFQSILRAAHTRWQTRVRPSSSPPALCSVPTGKPPWGPSQRSPPCDQHGQATSRTAEEGTRLPRQGMGVDSEALVLVVGAYLILAGNFALV